MKKLLTTLGILITIGTFAGMVYAFTNHYAEKAELEEQQAYTQKEFETIYSELAYFSNLRDLDRLEDELNWVEKQLHRIEDRWGEKFKEQTGRYYQTIEELLAFMPEEYREEYRDLEVKRDNLKKQIAEKSKKVD